MHDPLQHERVRARQNRLEDVAGLHPRPPAETLEQAPCLRFRDDRGLIEEHAPYVRMALENPRQ